MTTAPYQGGMWVTDETAGMMFRNVRRLTTSDYYDYVAPMCRHLKIDQILYGCA